MSEEDLEITRMMVLKQSRQPLRSMQDLSKRLVGTRKGMFCYNESFRLDFENKMYWLGEYEKKLQRIENYLDRQHDIPIELLINIKNIIHGEAEDEVIQ